METSAEKAAAAAFAEGDYSEAVRLLTMALESDPNNALHYCNRALCHEKLEMYRKCIKDCDTAISLDANCVLAYLIKGRAQHSLNKKQEAIKTWQQGSQQYGPFDLLMALAAAANGDVGAVLEQPSQNMTAAQVSSATPTPSTTTTSPPSKPKPSSETTESTNAGPFRFEKPKGPIPDDMDPKALEALVTVAARGMVQHGVGDQNIDQLIALGYLQVNTGKFENGIKIFNALLAKNPRVVAAYLGRGTAYALMGNLEAASRDFSSAIEIDPKCADAYKRRGQTRAARGFDQDGLKDLTTALSLQKDHEVYYQRGLIYYKLKNYKRALDDFTNATKYDHTSKTTWNYIGICYNSLGSCKESIEAHMKALSLDPNMREAYGNMGQSYKDWGKADKAMECFDKAIALDPNYVHAYHMKALTWFSLGQHYNAMEVFNRVIKLDPQHFEAYWMRAVVQNALGFMRQSIADFEMALKLKPDHFCWYQKEIAQFWQHNLDRPLEEFNIDRCLNPVFKEYWCKRNPPSTMPYKERQPPLNSKIPDVVYNENPKWDPELVKAADLAWEVGKMLHQDAPGFVFNRRQLRMAGYAAVEIAQRLRAVFKGDDYCDGRSSSGNPKPHKFGWRDMYDITVKWRQYSEPNDPVWWVDLLTPEQFSEGFGSHTPIITGQCKVVRYGPMFARAFPIMKELMKEQFVLSDEMLEKLQAATTCEDLYAIMRRDFWVVTPCHSTASPGKIMEGTRLTLQYVPPEGYEYSIRTPGTPPRWIDYSNELDYVFEQFLNAAKKPNIDLEEVSKWILTTTFYWYNFMPLARGTAATGYIALLGMFLSVGIQITAKIPTGELIDWDGILLPTPDEFIKKFSRWLYPGRTPIDLASFDSLPKISKAFPTIRSIIEALNAKPSKGWV